jgi:hypothetical protein
MAGRSQLPVQIMENQTRFDLNAAVETWRQELAAQSNLASDDRRELETHLRDAIAGFQQRGLNEEESFWLARRRVGQPQPLGEEFVKANPNQIWRDRVFWTVLILFLMEIFRNATWSISAIQQGFLLNWMYKVLIPITYLIPVFFALMFCMGKMPRQIYSLARLVDGRFRLASFTLLSVLISLVIQFYGRMALMQQAERIALNEHANQHFSLSFFMMLPEIIRELLPDIAKLLILASILIWLMPTQNQKTPKRA